MRKTSKIFLWCRSVSSQSCLLVVRIDESVVADTGGA